MPGATYFVPVTEVTGLYLTILFAALGEQFAFFFHDDKDWLTRAAGIGRFGEVEGRPSARRRQRRPGRDDRRDRDLPARALRLRAGADDPEHRARHRGARPGRVPALRRPPLRVARGASASAMRDRTFAQILHKGFFGTLLMRLLGKNITIPQAIGLDARRQPVIKPYATAVLPDDGSGRSGVRRRQVRCRNGDLPRTSAPHALARSGGRPGGHPGVLPKPTSRPSSGTASTSSSTTASSRRTTARFRTLMAFQAHHIDTAFYDRFYRRRVHRRSRRQHFERVASRCHIAWRPRCRPARRGRRGCRRPLPVRGSLGRDRRPPRPLRRRGRRAAAPAAQRQPELVVRLARRDPRPARTVSVHRARLPGLRPVARGRGFDFRPESHSTVIEGLVDRLGLGDVIVFGYAWGGPIGLGFAGRRPELVRALVIGNTWAWPDDRLRVRLFSALMGGPLSRLLVDRLNLMLRALPAAEPQARPADGRRASRVRRPVPAGSGGTSMGVLPREIVAGRAVPPGGRGEPAAPRRQAGADRLAGSDPGFGDAELAAMAVAVSRPRRPSPWSDGPVHRRGRPRRSSAAAWRWWLGTRGSAAAPSAGGRRPAALLEHVEQPPSRRVSTSSPPP